MQPTRNIPNKKIKFLDTKIFIASLAVASTIGLWNLLSNNAVQADKLSPTPIVTLPPQPPAYDAQGVPPLPTLIPLVEGPLPQAAGSAQPAQLQVQQNAQIGSLRSVTAPDQTIVQKSKPVFEQGVVTIVNGGGGGGGRSAGGSPSAPAATTSSSHK